MVSILRAWREKRRGQKEFRNTLKSALDAHNEKLRSMNNVIGQNLLRGIKSAASIDKKIKELEYERRQVHQNPTREEQRNNYLARLNEEINFLKKQKEFFEKKKVLNKTVSNIANHIQSKGEAREIMRNRLKDFDVYLGHFSTLGKGHPTAANSIQDIIIQVRKIKEDAKLANFKDVVDACDDMINNAAAQLKKRNAYTKELDDYLRKQR